MTELIGKYLTLMSVSYTMARQGRNVEKNFTSEIITYLLTYLLTPRSRVLLEKLTGFQLVMKFPAFYVTRTILSKIDPVHTPHIPLPEDPSSYYPPIYAWVFQLVSFP